MIIGQDIHPEQKIYYWGAVVLEALGTEQPQAQSISCLSIYEKIKADHDISAEVFLLSLDWLYMLGAIEGKEGYIRKCF